jgi:hypothetical protein
VSVLINASLFSIALFSCLSSVGFFILAKTLNPVTNINRTWDSMTSHGFGGVRLKSEEPEANILADLAKRISEIKPIVWAHVVLGKSESCERNENGRYVIIFEFDELDKEFYKMNKMNHAELQRRIEEIPVLGHQIAADLWVIQRSYHNGC